MNNTIAAGLKAFEDKVLANLPEKWHLCKREYLMIQDMDIGWRYEFRRRGEDHSDIRYASVIMKESQFSDPTFSRQYGEFMAEYILSKLPNA